MPLVEELIDGSDEDDATEPVNPAGLRDRRHPAGRADPRQRPSTGGIGSPPTLPTRCATPVALQLALAEAALADPHPDTVALRAMAEGIVASCQQQRRLIEALISISPRSQRALTRQEPVDIAAITNHALQAHQLGTPQRAGTRVDCGDGDPTPP
jgi:signal transduction histidine kinase